MNEFRALEPTAVRHAKDASKVRRVLSPDIGVMCDPTGTYQELAEDYTGKAKRGAILRPLFVAFVAGSMVSLVTSERLTLRLVADGTINALIVLLAQIVSLAAVFYRKRTASFSRIVELSFMGYGPWLLWMILFSALWAFLSPVQAFAPRWQHLAHGSVFIVLLWSAKIDFSFLRVVMERSPIGALGDPLLQRAIAWPLVILVFGGGSVWPEITRVLHLS